MFVKKYINHTIKHEHNCILVYFIGEKVLRVCPYSSIHGVTTCRILNGAEGAAMMKNNESRL